MAKFILETKDLEFIYPDGTHALTGVNLTIEPGRKIAIVGSNGAGKSTLFLHLNGILKPSRGKIFFHGNEIRYKNTELLELRKKVGIVFQDPDAQLFSANVYQEISFGPLNLKLTPEQAANRVEKAMAATGISHLSGKPTHFLSYGQKKRVSIADVIAMEPEVIIFDEPVACLDPKQTRQLLDFLNHLNRGGTTVLLSTHDVEIAYEWADRVFVMREGAIIKEGSPQEVFVNTAFLAEMDLVKPLVVEIFQELVAAQCFTPDTSLPRNKEELFAMIREWRQI